MKEMVLLFYLSIEKMGAQNNRTRQAMQCGEAYKIPSYPEAFLAFNMTYNISRTVSLPRSHAVGFDVNFALSGSASSHPLAFK
jgi:hypothetical protein